MELNLDDSLLKETVDCPQEIIRSPVENTFDLKIILHDRSIPETTGIIGVESWKQTL